MIASAFHFHAVVDLGVRVVVAAAGGTLGMLAIVERRLRAPRERPRASQ